MIKNKKISFSILFAIILFSSSCGGTVIPYSGIKISTNDKKIEADSNLKPTPVPSPIDINFEIE